MNLKNISLTLIILLLFLSCTTSSPRNRGSLSGAMDRSRDGYEDERTVPDEEDDPLDEDDSGDKEDQGEAANEEGSPSSPADPVSLIVLVRGGTGFRGGPYFIPRFNGELMIGETLGRGHWEVFLFGGFSHLEANPSHDIYDSIKKDVFVLDAGIEGRFYPLPDLTFLSPYLMGRIGGMILFWQFENDLTAGSDTISSNSLGGLFIGTGIGVDFMHSEVFRLGFSVIPDVYLFGEETSQGFSNDYFGSQGVIRWALEGDSGSEIRLTVSHTAPAVMVEFRSALLYGDVARRAGVFACAASCASVIY